jgi:hypothetical protein
MAPTVLFGPFWHFAEYLTCRLAPISVANFVECVALLGQEAV